MKSPLSAFISTFGNCGWEGPIYLWPLPVIFVVALIVVNPGGNFPLNDDWIYGKTVETLLRTGVYERHPYGMPLGVVQILWGTVFCWVFGFSYTVLRASTLVLAFLCICFMAFCTRVCGASKKSAVFCALLLLANPLFLNLSFTFMTDIPYLTFSLMAVYWYLRGLKHWRPREFFLGSVFGALSFGVRQFGILLFFVTVGSIFYANLIQKRKVNGWIVIALVVPWTVAGILYLWFASGHPLESDVPNLFRFENILKRGLLTIGFYIVAFVYMGLFVFPWYLPVLCTDMMFTKRWNISKK